MRRTLVLSRRAESDLREIWVFTFRTWGETQADRYLDDLEVGLRECGSAPESGRDRPDVRPGYRSRLFGRHAVFYTFDAEQVLVQRVLHGSMDPTLHLGGEEA